jgi:hypothetical protein
VRAQVDRDLTTVSWVDRLLGLIRNLGHHNYTKSHVYPINFSEERISLVRSILSYTVTEFPCTYLEVPLSIKRLPKAALQPLVDKVTRRLPPWQRRLLNRSGRLT